jgi:hypothetical protein
LGDDGSDEKLEYIGHQFSSFWQLGRLWREPQRVFGRNRIQEVESNMYCSSCGTSIAHGLAYCNHCGGKLIQAQTSLDQAQLFPDSLIWAIVTVFITGLGAIIGLMALMKAELHFDIGIILFITLLSFALMTAIEGVLVWLLINRSRVGRTAGEIDQKQRDTHALGDAPPRQLAEPLPSVTEHTTRTFEPVYEKRK